MTSRPRLRLNRTQHLEASQVVVQLRDAQGAVTPPGKKARTRSRRVLTRLVRERFEAAVNAQLAALEATRPESSREDCAAALLAHAEALAKRYHAREPRAAALPSASAMSPAQSAPSTPSASIAAPSARGEHVLLAAGATTGPLAALDGAHLDTSPARVPPGVTFGEGWRVDDADATHLRAFHPEVVLVAPRIPQNTGTVARLCAALCARLHLVEPLGFDVSEKAVRRAGLDYWDAVDVTVHGSLEALRMARPGRRLILVETGGSVSPSRFAFAPGDLLVFGSETEGLPATLLEEVRAGRVEGALLTLPMFSSRVRSINLANSVSMALFAAIEDLRARYLTTDAPCRS
jgi:tRNA (cytidine/uridine-2'-O-)-methyltransferase